MKKVFVSMAVCMSIGMMTSCVVNESEDFPESAAESSPATVNLYLASGSGSSETRANTAIADKAEATIKNFTVGLFNASNEVVTLENIVNDKTDENGAITNSGSINTSTAASRILVAINPKAELFDGKGTVDAFKSVVSELGYTTSADGKSDANKNTVNSQLTTGLPMYGSNSITFDEKDVATVTVNVTRLVARVGIKMIKTDFQDGASKGAVFIPKEIYMYNVNDKCTFGGTAGTSINETKDTKGVCEMTDGTTSLTQIEPLTNYAYLSSGLLNYAASEEAVHTYLATTDTPYYFYVFPHDATNATKLVIKGLYKAKGASDYSTIYYPVIINNNKDVEGGDSTIKANNTYTLSVTIKGKGVIWPSDNIENAVVNVTLTVTPWTDNEQSVTIN